MSFPSRPSQPAKLSGSKGEGETTYLYSWGDRRVVAEKLRSLSAYNGSEIGDWTKHIHSSFCIARVPLVAC
jgi:hypothetical protein